MKFHRINALLLKHWYTANSDLSRIFDMVYWPILGIIIFGFTVMYIESAATVPNIIVFLLGGLIMWNLFERMQQDIGTFMMNEFWARSAASLFTTPVTTGEIFVALGIVGVARSIVTFGLMFLVAFFAYHFDVINGNPSAILFAIPLVLFGWALGILVCGLIFRFSPKIQVIAWSVSFLLQPIAAAYYPLEVLPPFLQKLAMFTPLYFTFEGYRLSYAGTFSWPLFIVSLAWCIIYLIIGYIVFAWAVRWSKKTGQLLQY
jgi:ABC-2 type transport system permease protein